MSNDELENYFKINGTTYREVEIQQALDLKRAVEALEKQSFNLNIETYFDDPETIFIQNGIRDEIQNWHRDKKLELKSNWVQAIIQLSTAIKEGR